MNQDDLMTARELVIAQLRIPEMTTDQLKQLIEDLKREKSEIFDTHTENEISQLVNKQTRWDEIYLSKQLNIASKNNFSIERLMHLIEIRDVFIKENRAYFDSVDHMSEVQTSTNEVNNMTNFKKSTVLQKYLNENNIEGIKAVLHTELNNNYNTKDDVIGNLNWALEVRSDLFQPFELHQFAGDISLDKNSWNNTYYTQQEVYLQANFSEKRYKHMIEVKFYLRERGVNGFQLLTKPAPSNQHNQDKANSNSNQSYSQNSRSSNKGKPQISPLTIPLLIGAGIAAAVVVLISLIKR